MRALTCAGSQRSARAYASCASPVRPLGAERATEVVPGRRRDRARHRCARRSVTTAASKSPDARSAVPRFVSVSASPGAFSSARRSAATASRWRPCSWRMMPTRRRNSGCSPASGRRARAAHRPGGRRAVRVPGARRAARRSARAERPARRWSSERRRRSAAAPASRGVRFRECSS